MSQGSTTRDVVFLIPGHSTRPYFADLYSACEDEIADRFGDRLRPIIRHVPRPDREFETKRVREILLREFRWSDRIGALVVVPTADRELAIAMAEISLRRKVPVIALTLPIHGRREFWRLGLPAPPYVVCDSRDSMRSMGLRAGQWIREREARNGEPTRVVRLPGETRRADSIERLMGFCEGLESAGLRLDVVDLDECRWSARMAESVLRHYCAEISKPIDVVVCASDQILLGARRVAPTINRQQGRAPMLFGFDAIGEVVELIDNRDPYVRGTVEQDIAGLARKLGSLIDAVLFKSPGQHDPWVEARIVTNEPLRTYTWPNIPILEPSSSEWVDVTTAAEIEELEPSTLRRYRGPNFKTSTGAATEVVRDEDGELGRDPRNRVWRKVGGRCWYLRSSLVNLRGSS